MTGELTGLPRLGVQHHHAHLAACLAEHGRTGPALGVTWDGTGFGLDGTVWGGEFLRGGSADCERVATLRPFRLLGGEAAVREPRRVALALLWELLGEELWERQEIPSVAVVEARERPLFARLLATGFRSPVTTSAGRLFDAVASLAGLRQRVSYEGQAAMALEFVAEPGATGAYPLPLVERTVRSAAVGPGGTPAAAVPLELDWRPLLAAILDDSRRGAEAGIIAARFHNALVEAMVAVARAVGEPTVALTGGCFQNRLLSERGRRRLEEAGFRVLLHRQVPPNDGGLSLGQVAVAAARLRARRG